MIAVSYLGRATEGKPDPHVLYQWSTAIGGLVQDGIVLVLVLALAGFSRDLLALRRPTSIRRRRSADRRRDRRDLRRSRSLYSALAHPGNEQGLTPGALGAGARGGLRRERDRHLHLDPVRRGADLPRARLLAARSASAAGPRSSRRRRCSGSRTASSLSLPVIAAFGCALAWIRARTDSVVPGMVLHGLFNLVALVAAVTIHG